MIIPVELNILAPSIVEDLIRLGNKGDGGYVIPGLVINQVEKLLSVGVGDDWSFEKDFLRHKSWLVIHSYDNSVPQAYFSKEYLFNRDNAKLIKKNQLIFAYKCSAYFRYKKFFDKNATHYHENIDIHNDVKCVSMQTAMERLGPGKIFVKIDIEGSEYRVIEDLLKCSSTIVGMVIEFHDLDTKRTRFFDCINLIRVNFEIVHLHANNYSPVCEDGVPKVLEISFLNKKICFSSGKRSQLPLPGLDYPNNPLQRDYIISFKL